MLTVQDLTKQYPNFTLHDVSFHLPKGSIMGFLGMNGAGKSTTLKCILNLVKADTGTITINGKDLSNNELEIKKEVGFTFGEVNYYTRSKIKTIAQVYSRFYDNWDEKAYLSYLKKFNLDENKRVHQLSSGMKVKLGITFALSHNAKLLILDEPTSGLDPIARDELLDLFEELVEDGEKSIIFSTHITSDLDKCAEYVLLIKDGKIIANTTKDILLKEHVVVSGNKEHLTDELKKNMIAYKLNSKGFTGLANTKDIKKTAGIKIEKPNLEDIMVYYNKGGEQ